jgi:hypothetical protein
MDIFNNVVTADPMKPSLTCRHKSSNTIFRLLAPANGNVNLHDTSILRAAQIQLHNGRLRDPLGARASSDSLAIVEGAVDRT